MMNQSRPRTVSELKAAGITTRPVKDEIRENLIRKIRGREVLFPGIVGYEDSVVPQLVNALLSRHDFILLGLRGQAKSRIVRINAKTTRPVPEKIAVSEEPLLENEELLPEDSGDNQIFSANLEGRVP